MATIRDVAKRAGVAPITVSRVLNNSGYVSAATRARVEQAAADLNFVPNMLAHSLRSNRTNTLALVVTDITNPFWTTVARGVEDVASDQNFNVIFCNTDESEEKQAQYLAMLLRRRVDGVLLVPASSAGDAVRALQAQDVKVVVLDRQVAGVEVDTVRGDSVAGARRLAEHLLQLGHRRIAMLAGPKALSVTAQRVAGYREALQARHVAVDPNLIQYGAFTVESGYDMAKEALARQPRPTALFAANNFIAAGALRALRAAALEVPKDISVVVFDELPNPYGEEPRLSAAIQPAYDLGQAATRLLLQRINGEAPEVYQDIVLPTELVVRTSSRRLAAEQA